MPDTFIIAEAPPRPPVYGFSAGPGDLWWEIHLANALRALDRDRIEWLVQLAEFNEWVAA
jgi:hypothetical protein